MILAADGPLPANLDLSAVLAAVVGTAIGAVARDWLVRGARARLTRADLGLLAAQVSACFVAGVCAGQGAQGAAYPAAFWAAGVAGGLSTWSTLAVETVGWWRARRWGLLVLHGPGALALAMAAFLGGRALFGGAE